MDECSACMEKICAMKPLPTSIIDLVLHKNFPFPEQSLYDTHNPDEKNEFRSLQVEGAKNRNIISNEVA
jgi:hypothetical protein